MKGYIRASYPTYYIFIEDFSINVSSFCSLAISFWIKNVHIYPQKSAKMKGSIAWNQQQLMKFIIITYFSDKDHYVIEQHVSQVGNLLMSYDYVNGLMVDAKGERVRLSKVHKDLRKFTITNNFNNLTLGFFKISYPVQVLMMDTPPYSYINESGQIIGVEGNVIDEFCRKYNVIYSVLLIQDALNGKIFDLSLYRRLSSIDSRLKHEITLNDVGASYCFLVPRNIPMFSLKLTMPFDKMFSYLFAVSVALVIILWILILRFRKTGFRTFELVFSVVCIIFGNPLNAEFSATRWSTKERFLLFPFVLVCFLTMEIFTSSMIPFSLTDVPMTSVQSMEELNASNTMVYEFYEDQGIASHKILNKLLQAEYLKLNKLPNNFDKNLAYVVRCIFADEFVKSAWNHESDRKIFDSIKGTMKNKYSVYVANKNFHMVDEFFRMVSSLQESGIMDFWTDTVITNTFPKQATKSDIVEAFSPSVVHFPFVVLILGLGSALIVFLVEFLYYLLMGWKLSRVINLKKQRRRRLGRQRILKRFGFGKLLSLKEAIFLRYR